MKSKPVTVRRLIKFRNSKSGQHKTNANPRNYFFRLGYTRTDVKESQCSGNPYLAGKLDKP